VQEEDVKRRRLGMKKNSEKKRISTSKPTQFIGIVSNGEFEGLEKERSLSAEGLSLGEKEECAPI